MDVNEPARPCSVGIFGCSPNCLFKNEMLERLWKVSALCIADEQSTGADTFVLILQANKPPAALEQALNDVCWILMNER